MIIREETNGNEYSIFFRNEPFKMDLAPAASNKLEETAYYNLAYNIFYSILEIGREEFSEKDYCLEIDIKSHDNGTYCNLIENRLILYFNNIPRENFTNSIATAILYELFYSQYNCVNIAIFRSVVFIIAHFSKFAEIYDFKNAKDAIFKTAEYALSKFPELIDKTPPPSLLEVGGDNVLYDLIMLELLLQDKKSERMVKSK